jgi:hypothetical protein
MTDHVQIPYEGRDDDEHLCDVTFAQQRGFRCSDRPDRRVGRRERMARWNGYLGYRCANRDVRRIRNTYAGQTDDPGSSVEGGKRCAITSHQPDGVVDSNVLRV